jgi:hypothetical protein
MVLYRYIAFSFRDRGCRLPLLFGVDGLEQLGEALWLK